MKQTLKLLSAVTLLSIAGCQFNKTPGGYLSVWEKNGVTDFTEIGKALLECGMPTPYDKDPESSKLSNNAIGTIEACMLQSGFRDKVGGGGLCARIIKPKTFPFVVLALSYHSAVSRSA